jgi:hypothetical protein
VARQKIFGAESKRPELAIAIFSVELLRMNKSRSGISRVLIRIGKILFCIALFLCANAGAAKPKVRISAWYWLNSAPKCDWEGDFVTMKNLGFTDVLIAWGLDVSGVDTRKADTKYALQLGHKVGLGVYLIVWQPYANSLPRDPKFMQVDAKGRQLLAFDLFNPEWRSTAWKNYLQDLARTFGKEPAMAGYVFDDSFGGANISYGAFEEKAFGGPLPKNSSEPGWDRWTKMRNDWWEDWAKDTVGYIREIDRNKKHEIYLEDLIASITNQTRNANSGVDFARVAKHFDAVGGYTVPRWTDEADSGAKAVELTQSAITLVREQVGPKKPIIYTFWTANEIEERKPDAAKHPTAAEIQQLCEAALKLGITHLDMYGYRIGEYKVTREQMAQMMPAEPAPYILTGQFPQKFMWDRPQIHTELGIYLRSLNGR